MLPLLSGSPRDRTRTHHDLELMILSTIQRHSRMAAVELFATPWPGCCGSHGHDGLTPDVRRPVGSGSPLLDT